jgi:hypothetical protein
MSQVNLGSDETLRRSLKSNPNYLSEADEVSKLGHALSAQSSKYHHCDLCIIIVELGRAYPTSLCGLTRQRRYGKAATRSRF